MDVLIIGGGVVGVSCAYELAKRGASVTVLERDRVGHGCSFGNAGWLTPSQATPLATISSKPWFPHALYLTKALAVELFTNQDDPRAMAVGQERDRLFREIRRKQAGPGERGNAIRFAATSFRDPLRI